MLNDDIEIMVNTSTNVTNALMHCRKLERTMLQVHMNDLNREEKKKRSFMDRRRAAFLQTFKIRRKDWWKMDTHVRENVRKDLDGLILRKAKEIRVREAELEEQENKKKKASVNYSQSLNLKNPLPPIVNSNKEQQKLSKDKNDVNFGNSKIPTILNHYSFPKNQQPQQPQHPAIHDKNEISYFKPNKMKLPEIGKATTQKVSINEHLNTTRQNLKEDLLHDKHTEIYRTKSIILHNQDSIIIEPSNVKLLEHEKSSIKLPGLTRNSTKLVSNSQSTLNNNSSSMMRASLVANYYDRSQYINQLKANGELSKEEEEFIDTLSRFLKRSPFYVERNEKYKSTIQEKAFYQKSKNKEKKISQSRDQRFENLVDSLVDFKAEFHNKY